MHRVFRNSLRLGLTGPRRTYHASVLPSLISATSPEFVSKAEAMNSLIADLEAKMAAARLGGGTKAVERMRSKGKKLPRERWVLNQFGARSNLTVTLDYHSFWTRIHPSLSYLLWLLTKSIQTTFLGPVS